MIALWIISILSLLIGGYALYSSIYLYQRLDSYSKLMNTMCEYINTISTEIQNNSNIQIITGGKTNTEEAKSND